MKHLSILIFLVFSGSLLSQPDSLKRRATYGCSAGLVNFLDYDLAKDRTLNKNTCYQGFDISLFLRNRKNNVQFALGMMGGDKYPVIRNLNYYLGVAYLLHPGNRKYILEVSPRIMYAYSKDFLKYSYYTVRKELSFQLGANAYRKINRLEIGLGYYTWVNDEQVILFRKEPFFKAELFHRNGFVRIGIVTLSARFILPHLP